MDSMSDLMHKFNRPEPPAVAALKEYVRSRHSAESSVTVTNYSYILSVKSAGLAGNLQHEASDIKKICALDKPLRIRIGY